MNRGNTDRGFTLIEVLIAMTLLSIMVVLLFGTLRICAESWEKGENKIEEVNEVAVVYNFFQRHLSAAKPLYDDFSVVGQRTFSFQGNAQSLQFVGDFPASAGRGGLQLFAIQLQDQDASSPDGTFINVTLTPFFPPVEGEELQKEEVTLIKHVRNFSLAYFGPDDTGEASWQNEWLEKETQPQLVKINIEPDNGIYWPEMIIELKVAALQDGAGIGVDDTDTTDDDDQGAEDAGTEDDPVDGVDDTGLTE
ncbi:MAG: prepilin-type N-terminal cleavage/methylation domain-containing protein [Methylovulum sp.]|nr:MAG: prepilin-type N-terminal cleavage/methylation domain-containing protein [Methylovulum sp.]